MEEIKTSIEKIFEQFQNDNVSYNSTNPKRLRTEMFSDSIVNLVRKRPAVDTPDKISAPPSIQNTPNTSKLLSDSLNQSNLSNVNRSQGCVSLDGAALENKMLKIDIMDYESKITQLRQEVESRVAANSHMESMYQMKLNHLTKQLDNTMAKQKDTEKYLKHYRKREAAEKEECVKVKNALAQQKRNYQEYIKTLQQSNEQMKTSMREMQQEFEAENLRLINKYEELESRYNLVKEEMDKREEYINTLTENTKQTTDLQNQLDYKQTLYEAAQNKIDSLEHEIAAFGEWKSVSKMFRSRVATIPDLEKEVERLKKEKAKLHDTIGNKLLLEEEVSDLKSRIEMLTKQKEDQIGLKTQLERVELELKDYQTVAAAHCPPNSQITPEQLRLSIAQILKHDIIQTKERGNIDAKEQEHANKPQLKELQTQLETLTKDNGDLQTSLKHHKTSLHRVQKKLMLVAKERDFFKQLIENYEKNLTITGTAPEINPDSQISLKVDMLEKQLNGYKEMCASLEKDLKAAKSLPDLGLDTLGNSEVYQRFKIEIAQLRQDKERLTRRKDELELLLERSSIEDAYNVDRLKVVHMTMNPSDEAHEAFKVKVEKLQSEIERLRRKNRLLEQDRDEITARLNETSNITMDIQELNSLRAQIKSLESKNSHLRDTFKTTSNELRNVVYQLVGYKVDRINHRNYRVSSMYAESDDDYFNFHLNEDDGLDLLTTKFSETLTEMMTHVLGQYGSMPAFLSTVTLELFNRTTIH